MCSSMPAYGYYSEQHRNRDQKCNIEACTAKQGALCGHTQEKCANCRGNHIAFSSRCAKKMEVTRAACEERRREQAGRSMRAGGATTVTNTMVSGRRAERLGGADRGRSEEEMADTLVDEAGEVDITMGEGSPAATTAMVTVTATSIEAEVQPGDLAAADV